MSRRYGLWLGLCRRICGGWIQGPGPKSRRWLSVPMGSTQLRTPTSNRTNWNPIDGDRRYAHAILRERGSFANPENRFTGDRVGHPNSHCAASGGLITRRQVGRAQRGNSKHPTIWCLGLLPSGSAMSVHNVQKRHTFRQAHENEARGHSHQLY